MPFFGNLFLVDDKFREKSYVDLFAPVERELGKRSQNFLIIMTKLELIKQLSAHGYVRR